MNIDELDFFAGLAMHALIVSAPNMTAKDRAKRAWEIAHEMQVEWIEVAEKRDGDFI